jgi:SAM-dependent methyltransferase
MKCLICGSKTVAFRDAKSGIIYHSCDHCECIFKDPSCHQSIQEQKLRYDLHENDEEDEGYRAYFQRFLDFVLPLVGRPESALDFGCGRSTLLANILNSMNIDTDHYDPIYHPEKTYDSKKYQLIVSTEVFEHLHDPENVFSKLVEHLEPGGYLALQTQFHPNVRQMFMDWYYHKDPTHIVFFTPRTFEILGRKHQCELLADNGKNMVVLRKRKV